ELFFLDEATAFAAGHRPCFYWRRDDAQRFPRGRGTGKRVANMLAPEIDSVFHRGRLGPGQKRLDPLPAPRGQMPGGALLPGRASFAPAPSAISLASAISRRIGAMPQLVVATMLLFGTNFETASITLTTSSAVSTVSLATSITPACTTLPLSRESSSSGTFELRHSIATCWIGLS